MKREVTSDKFNLAAIDIGSNAARILIKSVERTKGDDGRPVQRMKKLQFLRIPLRLGIDVFGIGKISDEREKQLIRTIKVFRQLLIIYNVCNYRACATSAFRDAKNGKRILRHIRKDLKVDIDIITGEEEARILRDCNKTMAGNLLYMDVGGGSTEISLLSNGQLIDSRSFNIGTLRLVAQTISQADMDAMRDEVEHICHGFDGIRIVGSGGNINKLYRLAPKRERKNDQMTVSSLATTLSTLSALSVERRMEQFDLREDRADVIVPAAQLFAMVAEASRADVIVVPTVGLADGIINELADNVFEEALSNKI
ncbi:MAG: Ppx/GppA family phosphatase [Bacteroidales bacterium]|nr:Ppx/GppA family phosphatase [Bacteroidales bacterium]